MTDSRTSLKVRLKRLLGFGHRALSDEDSSDPNVVGFDKYRNHGAYHWRELRNNPEYRAKIELLEELVDPSDTCLDLGCGDGAYVYALSKRCQEVVGIDADAAAARLATSQLRKAKATNARCIQLPLSQVEDQLGDEAPFDIVYSMDVIEHLPQPRELLEVACRMAGPSGAIVIGTPLFLGDHLVSEYHVKEYTREEYVDLVGDHIELDRIVTLRDRRLDGEMYDESFIVGVGRPRLRD